MKTSLIALCAVVSLTAVSAYAKDEEKKTEKAEVSSTNPVVLMKTSMGDIEIELDQKNAPISTKNFLAYVKKKHYDGVIFHRVIGNFMIQGGAFANGDVPTQKESMATIKNEAKNGLKNKKGTIAMARTGDPHSASAQFFINVKDNANLDQASFGWGYAVFGKVTKGMEVVEKIKAVKTGMSKLKALGANGKHSERPFKDVPVKPVVIKSVTVKK